MRIGVELDDASVTAVAVDDRVQSRASVAAKGDLPAAAIAAVRQVMRGVATPAPTGIASFVTDTPAASGVADALAKECGTRPSIVASGTAAAVAEAWIGAAAGARDVVFFAVSEHTTAGLVREGVPVTGARGRAASIAWLSLNPVEREDYRKSGCLEAEVAAAGIVRRLIWRIKSGDRSRVQDTVDGDLAAITVAHVLDAARAHDGVSISVVRDTAKYLGMAAANLVVVADPGTLVLGGFMASAADLLLEPVRVEISRRLPRAMMDALTIVPATLGADAAAIGAARLAATGQ
ncbi:MAG: ROK family protein [Acidobacteriia bacterium]|nr:ROK family protein [Terriglobia bacterium]